MRLLPALALTLMMSPSMGLAQTPALPPLQGLTISLSSSHQQVMLPPLERGGRTQDVLGVMATLRNRGSRAFEVAFADLDSARGRFVFSLYREEDDALLWSGLGQVPARVASRVQDVAQKLARQAAWSAGARIPLKIDGEWLATGKYRVEAVLAGSPSVFAALGFEVLPSGTVSIDSGLRGQVLVGFEEESPPAVAEPAVGAVVTITPVKSSNERAAGEPLRVETDAQGRFSLPLPPGEYWVSPDWGSIRVPFVTQVQPRLSPPVLPVKTYLATVRAGEMTDITLHLAPRLIIDPPPLPGVLVLSIEEASVERVVGTNGESSLRVRAAGSVPHPGFGHPRLLLSPVLPAIAPADGGGLAVLDFVVDPPNPALFYPMVISTVQATVEIPDNGQSVIWIHSKSGRTTLTLPPAGNP